MRNGRFYPRASRVSLYSKAAKAVESPDDEGVALHFRNQTTSYERRYSIT